MKHYPPINFLPLILTLILGTVMTIAAKDPEERQDRSDEAPDAGSPYTIAGLDLPLKWIPPGSFVMGSPVTERKREREEHQHEVVISRGFWIGACEVTVDQWKSFVHARGYQTEAERGGGIRQWIQGQWPHVKGSSWRNPGFAQTGDHPVVGISWNDAMAFCEWLTDRERQANRLTSGYRYALPTEAEWEYACRAGYEGPFLPDVKSMKDEFWFRFGDGLGGILAKDHTHPTGTRRSNAWGLQNVHGNVFEWCRDWFGEYPLEKITDPTGPDDGIERICRGGAWSSYSASIRSAFRGRDEPGNCGSNLGFRLSLSQEPLKEWLDE